MSIAAGVLGGCSAVAERPRGEARRSRGGRSRAPTWGLGHRRRRSRRFPKETRNEVPSRCTRRSRRLGVVSRARIPPKPMRYFVNLDGEEHVVDVTEKPGGGYSLGLSKA